MWQDHVFFLSYESCSFECVSSLYHGYVANPNSIPLLFNLKIQVSVFNADVFISVVKIANASLLLRWNRLTYKLSVQTSLLMIT